MGRFFEIESTTTFGDEAFFETKLGIFYDYQPKEEQTHWHEGCDEAIEVTGIATNGIVHSDHSAQVWLDTVITPPGVKARTIRDNVEVEVWKDVEYIKDKAEALEIENQIENLEFRRRYESNGRNLRTG